MIKNNNIEKLVTWISWLFSKIKNKERLRRNKAKYNLFFENIWDMRPPIIYSDTKSLQNILLNLIDITWKIKNKITYVNKIYFSGKTFIDFLSKGVIKYRKTIRYTYHKW